MTIELYHIPDAVCPFKVRTLLAEKNLGWESRLVTDLRDPTYLALNSKGVVPTLVHDGRVLVESRIISEYLDEAFPSVPLMPDNPWDRYRARWWTKQVDDSLHLNIFILTFVARGGGRAVWEAAGPPRALPKDPVKRGIAMDLREHATASKWMAVAVERFGTLFRDMEDALRRDTWLAGATYSLADVDLTAYLHRLAHMGLDTMWADLPGVTDWFDRVRARPSFRKGILDWLPTDASTTYAVSGAALLAGVRDVG